MGAVVLFFLVFKKTGVFNLSATSYIFSFGGRRKEGSII